MPKSKELVENTDSDDGKTGSVSEEEPTKSSVSKNSKRKNNDDVST